MRRLSTAVTMVMMLAAAPALAHEGHTHKVMGTVTSVQGQQLEIKATTGKTAVVVLDAKTRIVRGAAAQTAADIKTGDRVVVTGIESKDPSGHERLTAREVKLGRSSEGSRQGS
jgi:hypothetical protein